MFLKRTNIRVTEGRFALNPACPCRVREKGPGSCLPEDRIGLQVWTEPEGSRFVKLLGCRILVFKPDTFPEPRRVPV